MMRKLFSAAAFSVALALQGCGASCEECAKLDEGKCAACTAGDAVEDVKEDAEEVVEDAKKALDGN